MICYALLEKRASKAWRVREMGGQGDRGKSGAVAGEIQGLFAEEKVYAFGCSWDMTEVKTINKQGTARLI